MLDALRRGAGTWIAKIFIALLVLSFAVWGISGVFTNFGQNVAAQVGDTDISLIEFERAYRTDLNNFGRSLGRPLTASEGAQIGIPQQSLARLVAQAAMNDKSTDLKLGLSDDVLANQIQTDPNLQRQGGGFDRALLTNVLRNNGMSESEYVTERRDLAERQQLAQGVVGDLAAPTAYAEVFNRFQDERRDLSYLLINAETIGSIEDPTDDALQAFFEENKEQFKAPEYREVVLLEVSPEKLMRPADISDAQVSDEYERIKDRFTIPEKRQIQQMSFPNKEEAEAAAAKLTDGTSFADLMEERSLTASDVDLGLMAKTDILDKTIAEAAFAPEATGTTGVVEGRFANVILNIQDIQAASTQPLSEVSDEIRQNLAKEQAEGESLDLMTEIEDARAGGATLEEIADRFSVELERPAPFDISGEDETGAAVDLPNADGLVTGVFDSDVGIENDLLELSDRGFLWYEVTNVIPSRDRELSETRDKVVEAWKTDELQARIETLAVETAEKARSGSSLLKLSREIGTTVETLSGVKRSDTPAAVGSQAISQAFNGPANTVFETLAATAPARVVMRINSVSNPAFFAEAQQVQELSAQLSQQLQDSLLSQYVSNVEDEAGVTVNSAAVSQAIGLMTSAGQ